MNILLVEDNEGDIILTIEAFEESKVVDQINVLKDAESAILFFETLQQIEKCPDMVLLDINLPKASGHEVLRYIKNNIKFKHIPVIVLSTSCAEGDIAACYQQYANCFITKPAELSEYLETIIKIEDFWTNIVSIPLK